MVAAVIRTATAREPRSDSAGIRTRPTGRRPLGPHPGGRPLVPGGGAAVCPGTSLRPAPGPGSQIAEGGAAPPLHDPASPAPNPPETSVRLVPPSLPLPTPGQRRGVSLRGAYAASGWRVASARPVRLGGSCNFPSAPRWVEGLTRHAGGETPRAANRRAASGPVLTRGKKGTSGWSLPATLREPGSNLPCSRSRWIGPREKKSGGR